MVLILGMHRSGTSCLAGMLKTCGLNLGDEIQTNNRFNPKGNQEHVPSRKVNWTLMELNGGKWYAPTPIEEIPDRLRVEAQKILKDFDSQGLPFGIKDPRMLFCLDVWRDERTKLVGTIRHPSLVVQSLERRNAKRSKKVSTDWYMTWMKYNERLLEIYQASPFPIVNFDWPEPTYTETVKGIAESLGLDSEESFFDPELRNEMDIKGSVPESCATLYDKLSDIAEKEREKILSST